MSRCVLWSACQPSCQAHHTPIVEKVQDFSPLVGLQVLSRYALGDYFNLAWTNEFARSLMPWITFVGGALLERNRENIQVTIITDLLGRRQKVFVRFIADILSAAFLALVLYSTIGTLRADQGRRW